jgi:hypothetical protein
MCETSGASLVYLRNNNNDKNNRIFASHITYNGSFDTLFLNRNLFFKAHNTAAYINSAANVANAVTPTKMSVKIFKRCTETILCKNSIITKWQFGRRLALLEVDPPS